MSNHTGDDWLGAAQKSLELAIAATDSNLQQVLYRRTISTAYYAIFHALTETCAERIVPLLVDQEIQRLRRSINHGDIKKLSQRVGQSKSFSIHPIPTDRRPSDHLQQICLTFLNLLSAREEADYDLESNIPQVKAEEILDDAQACLQDWKRLEEDERLYFAQSLLVQMIGIRR